MRDGSNQDTADVQTVRLTEAERVYAELHAEILAGRLRPGDPLRQQEIARRLNASRTPVREAVARLAAEGLVDAESRRGAAVASLSMHDFVEINQLRLLLEPYAASVAAGLLPDAEIMRLEERLRGVDEHDIEAVADFDQDVHFTLGQYCNNARIARLITESNNRMAIARIHDLQGRHAQVLADLAEIISAVKSRDGELAGSLMRDHIDAFNSILQPSSSLAYQSW
jgi:DNA-binding GntR family transcriptional regulator